MNIKIFLIVFCVLFINHLSALSLFEKNREQGSVVIDYNSGEIISSYNHNLKLYPASLTKLMTLYIVFDKLSNNEITFDTKIKISEKASKMPPSKLGLPPGSTISIKDALLSMIVKSNNDVAYAVAEALSPDGTAQGFVDIMNQKVKELNLFHTHYENPSGLHHPNQYTTAYDVAMLSRSLMIHHNSYYKLFSISNFKWDNKKYSSTNHLLDYNGVDGIKTGYTYASGFNLVTSANKNNIRIIAVTLDFNSVEERDKYMKSIISESFDIANNKRISQISLLSKPDVIKFNNMNNQLISYENENENQNTDTNDGNKEEQYTKYEGTFNTSYNSSNSDNYSIQSLDYVDKLFNNNTYIINPYYKGKKYIKYKTSYSKKNKYSIQVGAFSSNQSAINASYKITKINDNKLLKTQNAKITKNNNNNYLVRFNNLTKNQAYNVCNKLKKYGQDCFVIFNY